MNKKKIYGPLARFLRAGVRPFLHRWDTSGAQKAQPPAVYVVHHRNMSGPVHTLALLPDEPRPWVLHVFLDRHECFAQYYGYTFRKRFGWPAPAAWAAAGVLSLTVPAVVRSFGAIPVYRSLKETRDMMEQSAQALLRGERSAESRNGAKALLEQLGLCKRLDHLPAQLSGGEQQRVARRPRARSTRAFCSWKSCTMPGRGRICALFRCTAGKQSASSRANRSAFQTARRSAPRGRKWPDALWTA